MRGGGQNRKETNTHFGAPRPGVGTPDPLRSKQYNYAHYMGKSQKTGPLEMKNLEIKFFIFPNYLTLGEIPIN